MLERDSVVARIDLDGLTANPALWSGIQEGVDQLRSRYGRAYTAHHAAYHTEALELVNRLEEVRAQVDALARFNEMPELGEPVGTDVPQRFKEVSDSIGTCTVEPDDLALDDAPHCPQCLLGLDDHLPRQEAEALFGTTAAAMRHYNRRLSSHSLRRILAHPSKEQLDKFISLVQVADPSALANVLDDDVVEFLRQFLRTG